MWVHLSPHEHPQMTRNLVELLGTGFWMVPAICSTLAFEASLKALAVHGIIFATAGCLTAEWYQIDRLDQIAFRLDD